MIRTIHPTRYLLCACVVVALAGLPPVIGQSVDGVPFVDASQPGRPFRNPPDEVNLSLKDCHKEFETVVSAVRWRGPDGFETNMLNYNGGLPGPTWRVMPGDKLTVTLQNNLGAAPNANYDHNTYSYPNTTNLHTHGMHISGMPPGDDVNRYVAPGERFTYLYEIDDDHMPGMFWYHPHVHGSGTLQIGSGLTGAIIVEDPPGFLPDQVANMPEMIMIIQHLNLPSLNVIVSESKSLLHDPADLSEGDYFSVNGQYQPVMTMEAGKWYRFRFLQAVIDTSLVMAPEPSAGCEMQLMAKDGMYLQVAPRRVMHVWGTSANRADVAIRCSNPGTWELQNVYQGRTGYMPPGGESPSEPSQPILARMVIIESTNPPEPDLAPFSVQRPCYLVDLRDLPPEEAPAERFTVTYSNANADTDNTTVNGILFPEDPNDYIKSYPAGTVIESLVQDIGDHPHHQHVNEFQVMEYQISTYTPGAIGESLRTWFQAGDWHDTGFYPSQGTAMVIRWQANKFTGRMQFHCHFIYHQDSGMVATYELTGEEGAMWPYARTIDPTCTLPTWARNNILATKASAKGSSAWPRSSMGGMKWGEIRDSSFQPTYGTSYTGRKLK